MSKYRNEQPDLRALNATLRFLPQDLVDFRRADSTSARPRRTTLQLRPAGAALGLLFDVDLPVPSTDGRQRARVRAEAIAEKGGRS